MKITLASHYGFCSGVKNAINIVFKARKDYPDKNIYLLNKLVHNEAVINQIKELGIIVLDDKRSIKDKIESINDGVIIFSAHGHDECLDKIAKERNLIIVDSICPRVKRNMISIKQTINNNKNVIFIGITNHPETVASLSIDENIYFIDFKNPSIEHIPALDNASIHNQTTLIQSSLDVIYDNLKKKINHMEIINDICFSTTNRQNALSEVTDEDLIIIIGDKISSNSTRLYEVAKQKYPNRSVYQVTSLDELKNIDISNNKKGFITAGASTPDIVINPIIEYLENL